MCEALGEAVADHDWTLATGESISGYIIFQLSKGQTVNALFLTVDVDQEGIAQWALPDVTDSMTRPGATVTTSENGFNTGAPRRRR